MRKLLAVPVLLTALSLSAGAQCVMCYRTAHAQNRERSRVMNAGIILLGGPPFLILAGFAVMLRRRSRMEKQDE
jgi:hypothetical protein